MALTALQNVYPVSLCHCWYDIGKTGLQQACITATTTMKICSSYRCAVAQHQCTATLFSAECIPQFSVLLCKTGLQQACVVAITPVNICSSYKCAMAQHQCTATLFSAKCSPHCSVLLCKTGLQQACVVAIILMKICGGNDYPNIADTITHNKLQKQQP